VKWSYRDISVSVCDYNGLVRYLSGISWYLHSTFHPYANKFKRKFFFPSDPSYRQYLVSSYVYSLLGIVLHNSRKLYREKLGDPLFNREKGLTCR
jgi:hypothetical protein